MPGSIQVFSFEAIMQAYDKIPCRYPFIHVTLTPDTWFGAALRFRLQLVHGSKKTGVTQRHLVVIEGPSLPKWPFHNYSSLNHRSQTL